MTDKKTSAGSPLAHVIDGGYCIGCGACALAAPGSCAIRMNRYGCYEPGAEAGADNDALSRALNVCPFADESKNEDDLAQEFMADCPDTEEGVGRYVANYAGYVAEPGYRDRGSSGGMVSWIAHELLATGRVNGVIHVKALDEGEVLFGYGISRTPEELFADAKSKYYPVELSRVLADIENEEGTFAIIALPCFAKALRSLMLAQPGLREKIPYVIGLFCGHLKSARYAENYGWQLGIPRRDLTSVDFRVKLPDNTANHYGVEVKGRAADGEVTITSENEKMFGTNWGYGFFKYTACDYCDDVTAELADISIGDAWLKPYLDDPDGNNIIVIRNRVIQELVQAGIADGRLRMDSVTARDVYASQASGIRHRREGLSYRLHLKAKQGDWAPRKRVAPSCNVSRKRRGIYRMRTRLMNESHLAYDEALRADDYAIFRRRMDKLIERYLDYYAVSRWHWARRKIKRAILAVLGESAGRRIVGIGKRIMGKAST